VIDGIRIAPHVFSHRRRSRAQGGNQGGYLDCGECQLDERERREWNCGHLPRLPDHRGLYPLPEGAPRPSCDTCPGYLLCLPTVHDAMAAHVWWDKGQLAEWVAGRCRSPNLHLYVEWAINAQAEVELERQRQEELKRR
jgi:hypothetical protein